VEDSGKAENCVTFTAEAGRRPPRENLTVPISSAINPPSREDWKGVRLFISKLKFNSGKIKRYGLRPSDSFGRSVNSSGSYRQGENSPVVCDESGYRKFRFSFVILSWGELG
jgi:hypothetical protein